MQTYGRLKMAHFVSILCFAVMVGCLVSIYSQARTMQAKLAHSEKELTANPVKARILQMQAELEQLRADLENARKEIDALQKERADRERTIAAQREELKTLAEQLRLRGGGK